MTYKQALEYIHSINWTFCKPGLERTLELCEKLGDPQKKLKFIHVAGTNGKGSFCSMMASVLKEAGLKVGMYTSPYIVDFCERMQVNGENIPRETLARLTEQVKPIADAMTEKPTEFELITAIAFLYFAEEKADAVVLECGMGGRLDSTNAIPAPLLSVITGIALDHTAFLGDTVEKIAREKAGIIKHASPVLLGAEDECVKKTVKEYADMCGSEFHTVDYSKLKISKYDLSGTVFSFGEYENMEIRLLGAYQPRNAALVLSACGILKGMLPSLGNEEIKRGLYKARWRARFEVISDDPLIIFDGAHNPEGIAAAADSIKEYFGDSKVLVVSGVLKDKDYGFISSKLAEIAKRVYTVTPDSPRALPSGEYAECIIQCGVNAEDCGNMADALEAAEKRARVDGVPIVCLGSLYTYGEAVSKIGKLTDN